MKHSGIKHAFLHLVLAHHKKKALPELREYFAKDHFYGAVKHRMANNKHIEELQSQLDDAHKTFKEWEHELSPEQHKKFRSKISALMKKIEEKKK